MSYPAQSGGNSYGRSGQYGSSYNPQNPPSSDTGSWRASWSNAINSRNVSIAIVVIVILILVGNIPNWIRLHNHIHGIDESNWGG